jgi:hypothetical protein
MDSSIVKTVGFVHLHIRSAYSQRDGNESVTGRHLRAQPRL